MEEGFSSTSVCYNSVNYHWELLHVVRGLHNIPLNDFTIILLNPFPPNGHFVSFQCYAGINKPAINVLIYLFYKLVNSSQ